MVSKMSEKMGSIPVNTEETRVGSDSATPTKIDYKPLRLITLRVFCKLSQIIFQIKLFN